MLIAFYNLQKISLFKEHKALFITVNGFFVLTPIFSLKND